EPSSDNAGVPELLKALLRVAQLAAIDLLVVRAKLLRPQALDASWRLRKFRHRVLDDGGAELGVEDANEHLARQVMRVLKYVAHVEDGRVRNSEGIELLGQLGASPLGDPLPHDSVDLLAMVDPGRVVFESWVVDQL